MQRVLILAGEVHHLSHLGLRHLVGIDPAYADAAPVHVQHDPGRLLAGLREEALEDVNDELQLHKVSSTFAALETKITRHVRRFARWLDLDLRGREVFMTDCWVNIMPQHAAHSLHLHPLAFISGTYYVRTPRGCPGLKFEDPRLDRFMAAPPRQANARPVNRSYVTFRAEAGRLVLFESWLRHEVAANPSSGERISVSFNYNWT